MLVKTPELYYEFYVADTLPKHCDSINKCKVNSKAIARSDMRTFFIFDKEIFVDVTIIKEVFDNDELLMQCLIHEFSEVSLVLGVAIILDDYFRASVTHYATVTALDEPESFLALPF